MRLPDIRIVSHRTPVRVRNALRRARSAGVEASYRKDAGDFRLRLPDGRLVLTACVHVVERVAAQAQRKRTRCRAIAAG